MNSLSLSSGDALDPELKVRPGDVIGGKYRIEELIGQGGMGMVVAATHLQLEERVAIKLLLPAAVANPDTLTRFAREARAAFRIKSEHVARIIDMGTLEAGSPYIVMEYLRGRDLGALVKERGALPVEDSIEYVLQACEAIAEAHALGIIHRDLKPQNLFLSHRADGTACIKVLDFGISKITGRASSAELGMTRTTTVIGSPLYMSPEQMTSARDVDARTDVWGLGAILYELLTGRVPFPATSVPQLCAMILQQPAPALRDRRPDAPEGLDAVIVRALEKNPGRRYANVAEFAHALWAYAPRRSRLSVERITRVLTAAGVATKHPTPPRMGFESLPTINDTDSSFAQTVNNRRRVSWLAFAVGAVALSLGAAGTVLVTGGQTSAATAAPPISEPATAIEPPETETERVAAQPALTAQPAPSPEPTPAPSAASPPTSLSQSATSAPRRSVSLTKASLVRRAAPRPATPTTAPSPTRSNATAQPAKKPVDLYRDRK